MVLAIDPGNIQSAWALLGVGDDAYAPNDFGKSDNERVLQEVIGEYADQVDTVVIEMVASYGMPVGREVFDTCVWIGRFSQAAEALACKVEYIFRAEEKLALCNDSRAKDTNIRRALIDRFAKHDLKNGKGTMKNPDWFYGFSADMWSAYAVGVTYLDKMRQTA